ncbi:MAG: DUF1573 domain-containing protein [Anaerolineaceae bacterium]
MKPDNHKTSTALARRAETIFLKHLHPKGNRRWDYALLVMAGVLMIALFSYAIQQWRASSSTIRYTPGDIVYGEKIQAVHEMGSSVEIQLTNPISTDPLLKPEIRISENFYDFGEVNTPQVLTRTFIIANFGNSPLIIYHAYTTCGCTVADFSAGEIPPGKVILMTLQFDTGLHNMSGTTVRRGVVIETNDPDHPIREIWIQASVR